MDRDHSALQYSIKNIGISDIEIIVISINIIRGVRPDAHRASWHLPSLYWFFLTVCGMWVKAIYIFVGYLIVK